VLELAKAARGAAPGTILELEASDPAIERDVGAWCAASGHRLLSSGWVKGIFHAEVCVG